MSCWHASYKIERLRLAPLRLRLVINHFERHLSHTHTYTRTHTHTHTHTRTYSLSYSYSLVLSLKHVWLFIHFLFCFAESFFCIKTQNYFLNVGHEIKIFQTIVLHRGLSFLRFKFEQVSVRTDKK